MKMDGDGGKKMDDDEVAVWSGPGQLASLCNRGSSFQTQSHSSTAGKQRCWRVRYSKAVSASSEEAFFLFLISF